MVESIATVLVTLFLSTGAELGLKGSGQGETYVRVMKQNEGDEVSRL